MNHRNAITIISYLLEPHHSVAAKRPSYWAYNFQNETPIDVNAYTVKINNASPSIPTISLSTNDINIIRVSKSKLGYFGWSVKVFAKLLSDRGYCKEWVLISGGPFQLFLITPLLKIIQKNVILDFRDPWANNHRFDSSKIRKSIKYFLETFCCFFANKIITVNESIKKDLFFKSKALVIPNGFINYDYRPNMNVLSNTYFTCGKITTSPEYLLSIIKSITPKAQFYYFGNKDSSPYFSESLINKGQYSNHFELITQMDTLEYAILFANKDPQISYTKIFDYMYLKKKIIILNDSIDKNSELKKILKDYPYAVFIYEEDSKQKNLEKIKSIRNKEIHYFELNPKYDRQTGVKILRGIISC